MQELFDKAKALHATGQLELAQAAYREELLRDPRSVRAHNNLGIVLEELGHVNEAVECYRRALAIRADLDAVHYNLGHALHVDGRLEEAIASYRLALQFNPQSVAAHYNLGTALHQQGCLEQAEASYRRALEHAPDSTQAACKLGNVLYAQGRLEEALDCFRRAAVVQPESGEAHFGAGQALEGLGRLEAAAVAYRCVLAISPHSGAAHERLGRVLQAADRNEDAAEVFRQWIQAKPGDPVAQHLLAACTGENVAPRAHDACVRQVFNAFAEGYDLTMRKLGYCVPDLLAAALAGDEDGSRAGLDVLDAGCGTGLCGPLLRPAARRLVGVDLSPEMLVRCARRGVYDDLVTAELTSFLAGRRAAFDLIVAADTLVYFGDLDAVLAAAAGALRPNGRLAFSVERLDESETAGFRLRPHGRYAHAGPYVAAALAAAGLAERSATQATLRRERGCPVEGLVVTARKEAAG